MISVKAYMILRFPSTFVLSRRKICYNNLKWNSGGIRRGKTHLKLLMGFGYDERHEGQRKGRDRKQLSLILYSYISRSSKTKRIIRICSHVIMSARTTKGILFTSRLVLLHDPTSPARQNDWETWMTEFSHLRIDGEPFYNPLALLRLTGICNDRGVVKVSTGNTI